MENFQLLSFPSAIGLALVAVLRKHTQVFVWPTPEVTPNPLWKWDPQRVDLYLLVLLDLWNAPPFFKSALCWLPSPVYPQSESSSCLTLILNMSVNVVAEVLLSSLLQGAEASGLDAVMTLPYLRLWGCRPGPSSRHWACFPPQMHCPQAGWVQSAKAWHPMHCFPSMVVPGVWNTPASLFSYLLLGWQAAAPLSLSSSLPSWAAEGTCLSRWLRSPLSCNAETRVWGTGEGNAGKDALSQWVHASRHITFRLWELLPNNLDFDMGLC